MEKLKQGRVLYLSGDDDIHTTLVPRLTAFGADLNNVFFAPDGMLPAIGSPELEALFESVKPALCVLDTLQHFLPAKVDINSANSTTNAMQPLKRLAEKYDCCIVIIQHISKVAASGNGGYSANFAIGSSAVNALFRSVWTLGRLKDDDGKPGDIRVLAPSKTNLVPGNPPCILFSLTEEHGFQWAGTDSDLTAEALYDPVKKATRRAAPAREEAESFLNEILSNGKMLKADIEIQAELRGISKKTLRDARENLGIIAAQGKGDDRRSYWSLPMSTAYIVKGQPGTNRDNLEYKSDSLTMVDYESPLTMRGQSEGQPLVRGRL